MNLKFINKGKIDELTLSKDKIWSSCITVPAKDDDIKALLHFNDSSNIVKDEIEGNIWNIIGSPTISESNAKFNNSCIYFNGSSGINTHIDLNKDEDLTIECWFYMSSQNDSSAHRIFEIGQNENLRFSVDYYNSQMRHFSSNTENGFSLKELYSTKIVDSLSHVALVYNSKEKNMKIYFNGELAITNSSYYFSSGNYEVILGKGLQVCNYNYYSLEYIDEFCIFNYKKYTSNFTPPSSPYSYSDKLLPYYYSHQLPLSQSIEDNVAVCLPFNDSFNVAYDLCSNIWNVTGSPTIEKFQNRTCIHLLSGQSIVINTPIDCINSTFTAEFWLYFKTSLINTPLGSNKSLRTDIVSIETDNGYIYSGYAGHYIIANKAKNLLNSWHHVALTVSNRSAHKLFVDGMLVASGNESRNYSVKYLPLAINKLNSREIYISNLIIYNGIAKYTENFTPSN